MPAEKKYPTPEKFGRAVDRYFESISRTKTLTEPVPTGRHTQGGKPIYEEKPILNDKGKEIRVKEFLAPPSLVDLRLRLGLSKQTWANYAAREEYAAHCERAKSIIEAWLTAQLPTAKNCHGIEFNLSQNYGWSSKVDVSGSGIEGFIKGLGERKDEF